MVSVFSVFILSVVSVLSIFIFCVVSVFTFDCSLLAEVESVSCISSVSLESVLSLLFDSVVVVSLSESKQLPEASATVLLIQVKHLGLFEVPK